MRSSIQGTATATLIMQVYRIHRQPFHPLAWKNTNWSDTATTPYEGMGRIEIQLVQLCFFPPQSPGSSGRDRKLQGAKTKCKVSPNT